MRIIIDKDYNFTCDRLFRMISLCVYADYKFHTITVLNVIY